MTEIGTVQPHVIQFRDKRGQLIDVPPQHIAGVSFQHVRHQVIGWLLAIAGGLSLLGWLWVLAVHGEFKLGQFVVGVPMAVIGVLLILGRFRVTLATTDGAKREASVPYWQREIAERYVEAVRSVVFRQTTHS